MPAVRKSTVEHAFGTLKGRMGATHLLTKGLKTTAAEMALHVLAYNMKRVISLLGVQPLLAGIRVRGPRRTPPAHNRNGSSERAKRPVSTQAPRRSGPSFHWLFVTL
jgi:hypothetical protein